MVRHVTFKALFASFLVLNIKLQQYVVVKVTWPRPGGWGRGFSQTLYCVVQGLRGMETMPLGWEPQ